MRYRVVISLVVAAAACICLALFAQNRSDSAAGQEEQAIRAATDSYTAAFNKSDLNAVLAMWASDAEYINESGKSTKGREALTAKFQKSFQENKNITLLIKTSAIRILKNDVAMHDGIAELTVSGHTTSSAFTAVWIKKDGRWLLSLVRDASGRLPEVGDGPDAHLQELGWLVGEWIHEDKDMKTTVTGQWIKGQKFLALEYSVHKMGEEVLSLTQIVGWDPAEQRLHSWFFDSRGGFGHGIWNRQNGDWVVDAAGITADGRGGRGTNEWKQIDNDTFLFQALDRDVGGQPLPDVKIIYKRAKPGK